MKQKMQQNTGTERAQSWDLPVGIDGVDPELSRN